VTFTQQHQKQQLELTKGAWKQVYASVNFSFYIFRI